MPSTLIDGEAVVVDDSSLADAYARGATSTVVLVGTRHMAGLILVSTTDPQHGSKPIAGWYDADAVHPVQPQL